MIPLACIPGALPAAIRAEHFARIAQLFGGLVKERRSMTDGYDYRFDSAAFDAVVRFVANERACCPFLSFALRIAADAGPIWLAVTGPAGTQSLLDAELR